MTATVRVPVVVLTGFLGSGKTTLLSHLIRDPCMARTAVIINEFGEIGLDHLLVAKSDENVVLMDSGCVCCSIRTDLSDALRDLGRRRDAGEVPLFDRVVIETTGLADPAPILHTLMTEPELSDRYSLNGVVTTVDSVHGVGQLEVQEESVKQAAVADRLVLTKGDIATANQMAVLRWRLQELNPAATMIEATEASAALLLFDSSQYSLDIKSLDVQRWLGAEAYEAGGECDDLHQHQGPAALKFPPHKGHDPVRHQGIGSFCITLDMPMTWGQLVGFLDALTRLRGPDLLRVKGIVNVAESELPVIIQGVQHLFHPPVQLEAWPSTDRQSQIVFITRNISRSAVIELLNVCLASSRLSQPS